MNRDDLLDGDFAEAQAALSGDDGEDLIDEDEIEELDLEQGVNYEDMKAEFRVGTCDPTLYTEYVAWIEKQELSAGDLEYWWPEFIWEKFGGDAFLDPEDARQSYGFTFNDEVPNKSEAPDAAPEGGIVTQSPSWAQGQGYTTYHKDCFGPHDGSSLDVAFKIGGITIAGSKASGVDLTTCPDLILDFSDTYSKPTKPVFITSGPERFKDLVDAMMPDLPEPGAVVRFKWADMGVPPVGAKFWISIWKEMSAFLTERNGKPEGLVTFCCMGGHGRTGTAMASLLIVIGGFTMPYAVDNIVRADYCQDAVESKAQIAYLAELEKTMKTVCSEQQLLDMQSLVTRPNEDHQIKRLKARAVEEAAKAAAAPKATVSHSYHKSYKYAVDHKTGCNAHYGEPCSNPLCNGAPKQTPISDPNQLLSHGHVHNDQTFMDMI